MVQRYAPRVAAVAAVCAAGCSGGSGGGDGITTGIGAGAEGRLSVALIDAPVTEVSAIMLAINQLRVKPSEGPAFEFDYEPALVVDLLELDEANPALLLDNEPVPAGHYEWIELVVSAAFDNELDSYVRTLAGGEVELEVPSGSVRLVSGFTITANLPASFTVDWDTRRGLIRPPGRPGYMLRPAFRIVDMTEYFTLRGEIAIETLQDTALDCLADSTDPYVGNVVYIYEELGAEPGDLGTEDRAQPIATVVAHQGEAGPLEFSTILSPGAYTIAFTCQAGNDDPETPQPPAGDGGESPVSFVIIGEGVFEPGDEVVIQYPDAAAGSTVL